MFHVLSVFLAYTTSSAIWLDNINDLYIQLNYIYLL